MTIRLNVHHLTRVEGHGNIRIHIENGQLKEASWQVVETPRFFEAMLRGKHYTTAGMLTARICGICSIGHCLASLRATENAFGVTVPEGAAKLRLLAKHGETLQSHYLHLFFLAAPDFLGLPSILPLIDAKPEIIHTARKLKGTANRICDVVAGRTTHPVSLQVGGVTRMPDKRELRSLRAELELLTEDLRAAVDLFRTFEFPDFERETEFVSLKATDGVYPFIGGRIGSSDGIDLPESDYRSATNEYTVPDNTSKWCRLSRQSYAVGALARLNNSFGHLTPEAKAVAQLFGLSPVCFNPFMNNAAQLIECVHVTHESLRLLDDLLSMDPGAAIMADFEPCAGEGVGAIEVPRGILYHRYEYDNSGRIVRADCVIPTTQNNANIHLDLAALVQKLSPQQMNNQEIERLCSMLVRAYDPCISCSVH